ncbi:hypothetical protein [Mesobacillus jeotgali]|uniref:hypothetical protein n=1 Tax=Mesobacillus jeotgali TaxID=129985 RepID=UPI00177C4BC6|nr:hypothetical protein [Mesobacillus jeotgali]UYZ22721.1 hypothetical protein FOF60_03835 [Mesobacillus jeotgali]
MKIYRQTFYFIFNRWINSDLDAIDQHDLVIFIRLIQSQSNLGAPSADAREVKTDARYLISH